MLESQLSTSNPSSLVKKCSGGFRLMTAFSEVARYCKPQPSLMPYVDSTLSKIGQWNYLAVTYLTKAFYLIPLARDFMKFCGVVTPFRGVRVYTRSSMGMPGSETAWKNSHAKCWATYLKRALLLNRRMIFIAEQTLQNNWLILQGN